MPVAQMFVLLCILVWLNETMDFPHLLWEAPPTPSNWREAVSETALIVIIGCLTILRLIHSITEQARTEEALQKSEEHLRAVLESARDAIFTKDRAGRYTHVNTACATLFGLTTDEMVGKTNFDLFAHTVAWHTREEMDRKVMETGEAITIEETKATDGVMRTFHVVKVPLRDINGKITGLCGIARDITTRKQAEERLRRHNSELTLLNRASQALNSTLDMDQVLTTVLEEVRHLLDIVACSVWLTDPATGELVCRQVIGPQKEIVHGWRLAPGQGLAGWVAQTGESLIVPDTHNNEHYFGGVDQKTGLLLRSILTIPLRIKRGVIGVLQVVDTEIARFKPADLMLLEPLANSASIAIDNARLVEAMHQHTIELQARNEELDAYAHTVAHDLKNPLAPIVGFADVLETDYTTMSKEEVERYLHMIARNGRKMSNIIDELLLLAEVRQVKKVALIPLEMATIVAEALQRLALIIEEHQAEITLPATWPVALGHPLWVEEVWTNYLNNAIKYGGQPPLVELGATVQADGDVCFWVRDNGDGIPLEEQARLFTPFTRLALTRAKGHGLGLSIVRRIMEKLGGHVGVESEIGRGSVFTFTLPGG
ncbi:MAG: PAS domain S-box protein [Chloroflexota bacterium]|nr:PAS domain S-box protein [Chloroflexota bacterium]